MLKIAIIGCLCAVAVIRGQDMPPPPDGMPPPNGPPPPPGPKMNSRIARQAMPMPPAMQGDPQMQGGGPGNLGMQGLGNIPDPTAIVAKAQEIGRQFMAGRRRRQLSTTPF